MRRVLITALLLLVPQLAAAQAAPQPIASADAQAVRKVIEGQLQAFQRDDAERAFSYAAPGIREQFGTAERFMQSVRTSYAVVYRPHSVTFRPPVRLGADLAQPVRMTDEAGHPWLVVYPMQRQADGSWRINGCELARLPGEET